MGVHCIFAFLLFATAALAAETESFLETEPGVRLYWRSIGSGENTVIVPGGFLYGNDFDSLAAGSRVIFYDMRNRGRSGRITDPALLTIEADVRDLEAIRRHFNIDRFATIGYSYLGKMVVLYALEHPARIERIVQIGPVAMRFGSLIPPTQDNSGEQVMDPDAVAAVRKLREAGLHESRPAEYCEEEWLVTRVRLTGDPRNAAALESWCDLPNEWPIRLAFHLRHHFTSAQKNVVDAIDVADLDTPVLTIHGTKDRNASYGGGREWAALLPNARLLTVEGAAHQVWVEGPAVLPAIRTFFGGHWPAGVEDLEIAAEPWLSQLRVWELLNEARSGIDAETGALRLRWRGALYPASQSRSSTPPFDPFPIRQTVLFDASQNAIAIEEELQWPNFTSRHRVVARGESGFEVEFASDRVSPLAQEPQEVMWRQIRRMPAALLSAALDQPAEARYLGTRRREGRIHHLVAAKAAGVEATLWLDEAHRLRRVVRLTSDPLLGDILEEAELAPDRFELRRNGVLAAELSLEGVEPVEAEIAGAAFETPEGFEQRAEAAPGMPRLEPLAPRVWRVTNIGGGEYASLVVEMGEELLIAEAPFSEEGMRDALALLVEKFPAKPVKTVVMTHHHFDHSGGIHAALAANAAIVTTPGNEAFVRQIAAAPRTLRPGEPIAGRPALRLVGRDPLVLAGDGPTVEVHRLDGSGHADEMLFVWLPAERILFQGDLFALREGTIEPARPQAIALLRRIDELGLDVERLVGVHGAIGSVEDLRESVRKGGSGAS